MDNIVAKLIYLVLFTIYFVQHFIVLNIGVRVKIEFYQYI